MDTLDYIIHKYNLELNKNNRKNPIDIQDTDRNDLAKLFAELGFKIGAEIGVERALYTRELCKVGLEVYAIDPWKAYKSYRNHVSQEKLDGFLEKTKERLTEYKHHIIRKSSMEAVKSFRDESLDFVYIDGNHTLPYVINDIIEWSKKVRMGGIISGHDYIKTTRNNNHVVHAVNCYVNVYRIPLFLIGSKEKKEGVSRDKNRSWFFIKCKGYK